MQFSVILFVVLAGSTHLMYGDQNISFSNLTKIVSQLNLIDVRNVNTDLILVGFFYFQEQYMNILHTILFLGLERKLRNQSTKFFG